MPNRYIFADEAGCFAFDRKPNVSRFFILCTASMDSCDVGAGLIGLRRRLAWEDAPLGEYFHACTDAQAVRDAVFELIMRYPFDVHATIMEKSKAQPQVKETKPTFYQYGWYYHFKHGVAKHLSDDTEALITTASIGNRKERAAFEQSVHNVMRQTVRAKRWGTDFCPAHTDPCLQVADYCAWAIQRKWERQDERSYNLIKDRIRYEYDLWGHGNRHYY